MERRNSYLSIFQRHLFAYQVDLSPNTTTKTPINVITIPIIDVKLMLVPKNIKANIIHQNGYVISNAAANVALDDSIANKVIYPAITEDTNAKNNQPLKEELVVISMMSLLMSFKKKE